MSKDETASGLLSKLVQFVRNPTTNWTELDSLYADRDNSVDKQLLNEMIERKRRNDFVRKRELDMLRKLRKLQVLAEVAPDQGGRPSFFQSSMTSRVDDRATTLKKIDEIEAQMSMQWWKTKNHTASDARSSPSMRQGESQGMTERFSATVPAYPPTVPAGLDSVRPAAPILQQPLLDNFMEGYPRPSARNEAPDAGALASSPSAPYGLMSSSAREVTVHDVELEEAAILFANGDDAGAEASLLEILAPGALRADHIHTWLTLFDLYRATGQQDKFESAALGFAERFSRSAPQWFSLPDLVKALVKPSDKPTQGATADWICPSVLGLHSVGALNAVIGRAVMPWRLDWSNLKTIDASALDPLLNVFTGWASQPVQLRFMGAAQLQKILLNATPPENRAVDPKWWLLRMEMLRVIHRPDDFELAALDYCVIYEVSPPPWSKARCDCKSLDEYGDAMSPATIIGAPSGDNVYPSMLGMDSDFGLDFPSSKPAMRFLSVELSGQIQGHAVAVLDTLETSLTGADKMQISCGKLIRVDFSAAGMLLNWVSARHAENRAVEFAEVNRLIAAFFNVIGITEYARVMTRTD